MKNPDKIFFSGFAADPEFDSSYGYEDLCDFDFDAIPDQFQNISISDDPDELDWDVF